jgi:hypothetical protein
MSEVRSRSAQPARRRDIIFKKPHSRGGRQTRAEFAPLLRPLLEYEQAAEVRKWCSLYFGGEFTAG